MMKYVFLTFFTILSSIVTAQNPLWLRHSRISPDGKYIAFTYKGDIYKVPSQGGQAMRLTTTPAYETSPIWSPNSKQIAFVSDREGQYLRIFLMSSDGGQARQLTFHSEDAMPYTFTKDGKHVIYASNIQNHSESALYPYRAYTQLYQVSTEATAPKRILDTPAQEVNISSDGQTMLYQDVKGVENQWRKHHTSSVTRDIWQYHFKTQKHQKIIDWKGEDRNPIYTSDNKAVYFLSERDGNFNVFKANLNNPSDVKQLTFFKNFPVRFLSKSDNDLLSFSYDGELYTLKEGEKPKKINVSITNDVPENQIQNLNFTSGATSVTVSDDGKQIAMAIRGEIFVTSADYSTTQQITKTAAAENGVTFSKDGRSLVYASYRDGYWDLYKASITRKEDSNFANALLISEEKLISNDTSEKTFPQFSPDGKEIAFVKNREQIAIYNLESKKVRNITDNKNLVADRGGNMVFSWSPDSKWLLLQYVARQRFPYFDIGIVSAQGGEIFNITDTGYFDYSPRWAMDGNAIIWSSDRYGMRNHASWGSMNDIMMVFLNKEAYNKYQMNKEEFELYTESSKKKDKEAEKDKKNDNKKEDTPKTKDIIIDFENIQDRIVRLTPNSSHLGDAIISKDGKKLYYLASFESGHDLWVHDLREKSTKLLSKLNGNSLYFDMDKNGKNIFIFGQRKMQILELPSEKLKNISFTASMKLNLEEERKFMFDMVKKEIKERFYVKNLHNVNWEKLTESYRKYLPHINNNYDFAEMLSELLGELNVSHTGSGYRSPKVASQATAQLGVFTSINTNGKGLIIDEILPNGPFDNFQSQTQKGHIIEKIDNETITQEIDFATLLEGKAGKRILVSLFDAKENKRWDEVIKPISATRWNALLYNRWVKQRASDVEKWSNGRLGYVHIPSMGDPSFRSVYADALGKYSQKEGIIIDIRYNGGGRLHEDIEVFFSGKKYLTQKVQGKKYGDMPSRRWNKPSIMLINEADYSNAHGTPWVYQTMGIGKLVGMPVPGTMTSVNWVTLQDPSLYFGIPVVGYEKDNGEYLENYELQPDVKVELNYEKINKGEDIQLKKAVEELLKSL